MVRIIDGEIVQDDDPRLQQRRPAAPGAPAGARAPPAAHGGGAAPAAATGPAPVFDWNAPALRIVPDDGTGLVGLPSVRLFGALLKSQHLLMLAAATLFMGWRGALLGAVVWFIYTGQNAQHQAAPANQASQERRMAAAQNYFERMMQQAPLGRGGDSATPGAGSSGAAGGAPRQPQDPWAARGKAHKLSDS